MEARGPAGARLNVLTLNVQGLNSHKKLHQFLTWAGEAPYDVFMLQECHCSNSPFEEASRTARASIAWPGPSFYSPGTAKSKGCLILIKPSVPIDDPQVAVAQDGRILRVDGSIFGEPDAFVCVYAPASTEQANERAVFFEGPLAAALPRPEEGIHVVMGGDFNCILDPAQDRTNPLAPSASRSLGARQLTQVLVEHGLIDAWREQHPVGRDFTHWSASSRSGARLDRIYVSPGLQPKLGECRTVPIKPVPTDHLPVSLSLLLPATTLPPQLPWRFRVADLCDPTMDAVVQAAVSAALEQQHLFPPRSKKRDLWHLVKLLLGRDCGQHAATQAKVRRQQLRELERRADAARQQLIAAGGGDGAPLAAWLAALRAGLDRFSELAQRAHSAEGVLDHLYWERSTFVFHRQGAPALPPTTIAELHVPGSEEPVDLSRPRGHSQATAAFVQHYSADSPTGVFAQREVDVTAQARLLAAVHDRLDAAAATACEGPAGDGLFTLGELQRALQDSARGRAPGLDGLPVEFYAQWWALLGPLLLDAVNEAFQDFADPAALAMFLWGLIILIYKGQDKDRRARGSYRPITLLNVDIKILAKAMGTRMQVPLDLLIDPTQAAFIQGRDITDHVLYQLSLAEYLRDQQHPLYVMFTDLAGAYDAVDWGFLSASLKNFGFKEQGMVRWAMLLHRGARLSVLVNGRVSNPFPMRSGLLQGSGASPLLWCAVVHSLVCYLSSLAAQGRIHPPPLPAPAFVGGQPTAPASTQFADDMALPCGRAGGSGEGAAEEERAQIDADGPEVVAAYGLFSAAGGPDLSVPKTVVRHESGPPPDVRVDAEEQAWHRPTGCRASSPPEYVKFLGVPSLVSDFPAAQALAHAKALRGLHAAQRQWHGKPLSLIGRIHVEKQCLASKPVYQAGIIPPDAATQAAMDLTLRTFVARTSLPEEAMHGGGLHPCKEITVLPEREGGLAMCSLPLQVQALNAKHIARLFLPHHRLWQPLMRAQLALADAEAGTCTWVITAPTSPVLLQALSQRFPRLAAYVTATAALSVRRVVAPEAQSPFSILAEPLFHNPLILREGQPLTTPQVFASAEAQEWRHLRDVRAAVQAPAGQPSAALRADVDRCLAWCQPAKWREVVQGTGLPAPAWEVAQLPGCVAARKSASPVAFCVGKDGRVHTDRPPLQLLPPPPAQAWLPAATYSLAKPQFRWTEADWAAVAAARAEGRGAPAPREEWLLGPWAEVQLDPAVWGFGTRGRSLLDYTVKEAAASLACAARQAMDATYVPGCGLRPAIWGPSPQPPQVAEAAPPPGCPVAALDARRLRAIASRSAAAQRQLDNELRATIYTVGAAWVNVQHQPQPRAHVMARREAARQEELAEAERRLAGLELSGVGQGRGAGGEARAQQGTSDPGGAAAATPVSYRSVWGRLREPTLARTHRVTCWRLLHGALRTNVYRVYASDSRDAAAALCDHPACQQAGEAETLTHAFLACPSISPAVEWLRTVWHRLTGHQPPLSARLLLGDDQAEWNPAGPDGDLREHKLWPALWTRLRVALLGTIWHLRSHREAFDPAGAGLAPLAVALTVDTLVTALRRDWLRCTTDVRLLSSAFPADYFRGRDPALEGEDFEQLWGPPGLLWDHAAPGPGITVKLSAAWPVPAPVLPAPAG